MIKNCLNHTELTIYQSLNAFFNILEVLEEPFEEHEHNNSATRKAKLFYSSCMNLREYRYPFDFSCFCHEVMLIDKRFFVQSKYEKSAMHLWGKF